MEYIYYLRDPATNEVRWVGHTEDPQRRLRTHCAGGSTNVEMTAWVKSLRPARPLMQVICIVQDKEEALDTEARLSKRLRTQGVRLLNMRDGSEQKRCRVGCNCSQHGRRGKPGISTSEPCPRGCRCGRHRLFRSVHDDVRDALVLAEYRRRREIGDGR